MTISDLAKAAGVSVQRAEQVAKKYNLPVVKKIEKIERKYKSSWRPGITDKELADIVGVRVNSARKMASKLGLELKRGEHKNRAKGRERWWSLFKPGMTVSDLAKAAGVKYPAAFRAAKKFGIPVKKQYKH